MLEVLGDIAVIIGFDIIDVAHDILNGGLEPLFNALRDDIGGEKKEQQRRDDGKGDEKKDQLVLEAVPGAALIFFKVHFQDVAGQNEKKGQAEKDDDDPQAEDPGAAFQGQGREIPAFLKVNADDDKNDKKQNHGRHDQTHALDIFVFHSPIPLPPPPALAEEPVAAPSRPGSSGTCPSQFSMIAGKGQLTRASKNDMGVFLRL